MSQETLIVWGGFRSEIVKALKIEFFNGGVIGVWPV